MIISFKGNTGGGGYVLPPATTTTLGGIKVGSGVTVDSAGTLANTDITYNLSEMTEQERAAAQAFMSANRTAYNYHIMYHLDGDAGWAYATQYSFDGNSGYIYLVFLGRNSKFYLYLLRGNGQVQKLSEQTLLTSLPTASSNTLGGVKVGSGLTIDSGGTLTNGFLPVYIDTKQGSQEYYKAIFDFVTANSGNTSLVIYYANANQNRWYEAIWWQTSSSEFIFAIYDFDHKKLVYYGIRSNGTLYENGKTEFITTRSIATTGSTGIVKIGSGLTIDSGGTLSAEGGSGVQVVSDLSEITNPTSGMTALIPQGTPYHGKGWRFVPSGSNFQFTFVDNEQHVRIFVYFGSRDEMVFYVNNGQYQISERVLRDGNYFEGFSYAANAVVKVGYSGTSVAYVDVLFVEGVDKWMELTDSGSTTVTPIEYDVLVPMIDYDREYVYRGATLVDKQISGYTIDVSQFSADDDVYPVAEIEVTSYSKFDPESVGTHTIYIGYQYGPYNNGVECFYVKSSELDMAIALTDDNKWRFGRLAKTQELFWFKQSGTTIYIKPWLANEGSVLSAVTVTYQRGDVSTAPDNTNLKVVEGWEPKHTKPFTLTDNSHILLRHGYDVTLLLYKTLGAFAPVYFQNFSEQAEGIDTFLFRGNNSIGTGSDIEVGELPVKGIMRVMLGDNCQVKVTAQLAQTENGIWYGDGFDWSYSQTSYPGSSYTIFTQEPWVDEDGHLRFGDTEYSQSGTYYNILHLKNLNFILGSVNSAGRNELEACFPIIPLRPVANDDWTTVTCPTIKRYQNNDKDHIELNYTGYRLSFDLDTWWDGYWVTEITNATLTTLS